ncbi:MAG: hypothetical protein QW279_13990, partial [Candidatus Jordarchaeaceae archaeon]
KVALKPYLHKLETFDWRTLVRRIENLIFKPRAHQGLITEYKVNIVPDETYILQNILPIVITVKYARSIEKLRLIYQRDPLRRNERLATAIAGSFKDCGITVEVIGLSTEQYYEALRESSTRSYDMALVEYYTTSSFASIKPLLDENGPLNYGRFNSRANGSYDNYLTSLLNDVEGDNAFRIRDDIRFQKYREIHKLCHENEYHVWLFAPQTKVYYNSNTVKVNYFSPERPFKNITEWDVIK